MRPVAFADIAPDLVVSRQGSLQIVEGQFECIKIVPFEKPYRETAAHRRVLRISVLKIQPRVLFRELFRRACGGIAQVIYHAPLVAPHHESMERREILCTETRVYLAEIVARQVQVLQFRKSRAPVLPEEGIRQGFIVEPVCRNGESLQDARPVRLLPEFHEIFAELDTFAEAGVLV